MGRPSQRCGRVGGVPRERPRHRRLMEAPWKPEGGADPSGWQTSRSEPEVQARFSVWGVQVPEQRGEVWGVESAGGGKPLLLSSHLVLSDRCGLWPGREKGRLRGWRGASLQPACRGKLWSPECVSQPHSHTLALPALYSLLPRKWLGTGELSFLSEAEAGPLRSHVFLPPAGGMLTQAGWMVRSPVDSVYRSIHLIHLSSSPARSLWNEGNMLASTFIHSQCAQTWEPRAGI